MHIVLWSLQVVLAAVFLLAGGMKLGMAMDALVSNGLAWVKTTPEFLVRLIGLSEVLGGLGLIVPAALNIKPRLTPVASALLSLVMLLAVGTHVVRAEYSTMIAPLVLGCLSAFVAWKRWS